MKALIDNTGTFVRNTTEQNDIDNEAYVHSEWTYLDSPYEGDLIAPRWNGTTWEENEELKPLFLRQIEWNKFQEWLSGSNYYGLAYQYAGEKDYATLLFALQGKYRNELIISLRSIANTLLSLNHIQQSDIDLINEKLHLYEFKFSI